MNQARKFSFFVGLLIGAALTTALCGCTSFLADRQGRPEPGKQANCPINYRLTRGELSSLQWAFIDGMKPSDACLAHYYPKAAKDSFYQDANRVTVPLYLLSLPIDVVVDTVALPFTVPDSLTRD